MTDDQRRELHRLRAKGVCEQVTTGDIVRQLTTIAGQLREMGQPLAVDLIWDAIGEIENPAGDGLS